MDNVDIVVLSWNRTTSMFACIDSVLAQEGISVRVILIDQASDSETFRAIESYADAKDRVSLVRLDLNLGVPGGRDKGMKLCDSEWVFFLDNDAVLHDTSALRRSLDHAKRLSRCAVLTFMISESEPYSGGRDSLFLNDLVNRGVASSEISSFLGGAHLMRRSAYEEALGYDERLFFLWEEFDLSVRLRRAGWQVYFASDLDVLHHYDHEGAKLTWRSGRYYYFCRNGLFLRLQYYGVLSSMVWCLYAIVRGFMVGAPRDAARGIVAGVRFLGDPRIERGRLSREEMRTLRSIRALEGTHAVRLRRRLFAHRLRR